MCSSTGASVCDALRIQVTAGARGKSAPQFLSISLLKLDADRLMAVLADITRQVMQERMLRQSDAWLNAILPGVTGYALLRLNKAGRIDDWNPSIGRISGFAREAVVGQPVSALYPDSGTTPDRVLDRLREADESGWSLDEGWRLKADGSRFWGSAMISPLRERDEPGVGAPSARAPADGDGNDEPAYCLIIRDITDKREARQLHRQATSCDHLTGLANRCTFFEAAELEMARGRRSPRELSIVMFDADHFMRNNDTHGHPAGDAVLRHLPALLTATFREVDVVTRIGGEEFAVLLPSTGLAGAFAVAERLRIVVAEQAARADGVATMDDPSLAFDTLLKRADSALYAAKAAGRNRVEYWPECGAEGQAGEGSAAVAPVALSRVDRVA